MSLADRLKEMLGAKQSPAVKRPTTPLADLLAKGKANARPSVQADVVGEATRALVAAGRFEAPAEDHKPLVTLLQPKVVGPSLFAGISKAGPKTRKKSVEKQENVKKLSLRLLQEMGKDPEDYAKNSKIGAAFRANGVSESSELDRVHRLPRRSSDLNQYADLSPIYARPGSKWKLWPVQNAILHEARKANGLLGPVGVGHGKTISSLLVGKHMDAKRIVLLVPPQLRVQLIQQDIPRLNKEFYLPLERLSVVAYSELSSAKSADILEQLNPDLIVADECHNLRHRSAARSKRFARFMKEHPECRFVGLSGTITRRSLKDFGHLAEYALRGRSPLPHNYHTLNEWAEALDVGKDPLAAGELKRFCNDEELAVINSSLSPLDAQPAVRSAFRRRLVETPGVVSTEEGAIGTSLVLRALKPRVPAEVQIALQALRNTWCVGEDELVDILSVIRAGCQISGGFFYRWIWPDGQKDMEWLEARKMWHQELREILKLSRRGLDSPLLVENAIRRGELESAAHEQWEAVRGRFNPTPPREAVWIDDFLVKESVQWAKENCSKASPGIIWYSWQELGEKIAAMGGFPFIGGGADAELAAIDVKKTPVIVASQKAHGTGKNLQAFCQNLFTTPMGGGVDFEQTLARTHRPGQLADEVNGDVFVHTFEMERSWLSAMKDARYIEDSQGQKQKLLYAEKIGFPEDE